MSAVNSYILTSKGSKATVTVGYNSQGLVCSVAIPDEVGPDNREGMFRSVPIREGELSKWMHAKSQVLVQKVVREVTFQEFYWTYPVHERKLRASKLWDKLGETDRLLAFNYIAVMKMKKNASGQYWPAPDSYLAQRRWED